MKLRDLVLLLPSYELDGYPRTLPASEARDLLSGWVALWHPLLLAAAQAAPRWLPAGGLPGELHDILFVLPSISLEKLEPDSRQRIAAAGGWLLEPNQTNWRDFQSKLLCTGQEGGLLSDGDDARPMPPLVGELRADFAALGYAYLQIQLMTRQLRYTSNLDIQLFGEQLTAAATATLEGDRAAAERLLQACFDILGQERDHYYSLDVQLLDVTLLAPTTLGKSFDGELACTGQPNHPSTSFLASGELLRTLQREHPERLRQLQQVVDQRRGCLLGGLDIERPHPLMSREAIARDFARGRQAYGQCGFQTPRVFARGTYGLSPESVSMLRRWGFEGCLLIAWSSGSYPQGSQAKISWEAPDGTFLSALATTVLDAANPASYLALGWSVGEALDQQHVPTLVFAHWPNQSCQFAELLSIVARRTPALGKWRLVDDYFAETDQPYHQERLTAASFRHNWLVEASTADLIRATQINFQLTSRCRSLQNLFNLAWQLEQFHQLGDWRGTPLERQAPDGDAPATEVEQTPSPEIAYAALPPASLSAELAELADRVDALFDIPAAARSQEAELNQVADQLQSLVLERLAKQLLKPASRKAAGEFTAAAPASGRLLINPRSAPVRVATHTLPTQHFTSGESWHFAEGRVGESLVTCIDIPSLGFVVAPLDPVGGTTVSKQRPLSDGGGLLSNEFLEAQIDSGRGHLRSLHVPAKRGNRLSLMIARRDQLPTDSKRPPASASGKAIYSEMLASDVRMLTSSNICGVTRAVGHLDLDGRRVARFEIDYEVWRGSRIVEVNIRLSELAPLASDNPWRSAYILRLAWPTEAAILRTYAGGSRQAWSSSRAVTPSLVEIDEVDYRTHYLPGGLAFHRRTEERFLETILAVQGDTEVRQRIGVAVDLPHPSLAAEQFVDTPYELTLHHAAAAHAASGWLASVDTRSVTVDLETPLVDAAGKLVGMRLFITELEGKSSSAKVRLLRELASAARVDYLGGKIGQVTSEGDQLTIALRAHEQASVDVLWK